MAYVVTEDEVFPLLQETLHTLNNLRYYTKQWSEHYGNTKAPKVYWEEKADKLLERLGLQHTANAKSCKVDFKKSE